MRKLTNDRKCPSIGTIQITSWYNSDMKHLPQMNSLLPFAPTHISWYQTLHFWQHTQSPFFIDSVSVRSVRSTNHTRHPLLPIYFL